MTFGFLSSYLEAFEFSVIVLDLIPKIITNICLQDSVFTNWQKHNQSINQLIKAVDQLVGQVDNLVREAGKQQSLSESVSESDSVSVNGSVIQSVSQTVCLSVGQWLSQSVSQAFSQLVIKLSAALRCLQVSISLSSQCHEHLIDRSMTDFVTSHAR